MPAFAAPRPSAMPIPTSTMRQQIHLVPRRMTWDFSQVAACPVRGDPGLAAFLVAVSYLVVAFEDWAIPVLRNEQARLADQPAMARECQAFLSQEALHSQGHAQFNAELSGRHHIDIGVVVREASRFKREMGRGSQHAQLAAVAALEHVIYSIADWYENATGVQRLVDPEFHRLLLWHSMEETEHTAVVFDILRHLYGDGPAAYRTRVAALLRGSRVITRTLLRMWRALLPQMQMHSGLRPGRWQAWSAAAREGSHYVGDYLSFLRPAFTPWPQALPAGLLPRLRHQLAPAHAADEAGWQHVRVSVVREVAADVRLYELVSADGANLAPWSAGAHIDVEIETGVVRQYSLCGDPLDRRRYLIAVKREQFGRGGSLRMHQEIGPGHHIRVGIARHHFSLPEIVDERCQFVLIAGGIGVTPLLAMAHALHARCTRFTLHLCARDMAHLPFGGDIQGWPFRQQVRTHTGMRDVHGRLDLAALVPPWEADTPRQLYTCGPAAFMDKVCASARAAGWPKSAVHIERFAHSGSRRDSDRAFEVRLQRSGVTLTVAAQQSIVEAMELHGLQPVSACREGVCGACVCQVVSGEVDHRDAILSDAEHRSGGRIAVCVSRAAGSQLVLDL